MWYDDTIKEYADLTYNLNKLYCNKYGIELNVSNKIRYIDVKHHPAWERLPFLLENINKYDYVIWVDADAFFFIDSPNIVETIIKDNLNYNLIFGGSSSPKEVEINRNLEEVNTGIFIVKNTEYSINFLKEWAYNNKLFKNNSYPCWWEQGVLMDMFDENILNIKNNSKSIKTRLLQYVCYLELDEIESYKKCNSPLCHLAGVSNNNRIFHINKYYNSNILEKSYKSNIMLFLNENNSNGKKYTWESSEIIFLSDKKMIAFGSGDYEYLDHNTIIAKFGSQIHFLVFNDNYTEFISTRKYDNYIVIGKLIN